MQFNKKLTKQPYKHPEEDKGDYLFSTLFIYLSPTDPRSDIYCMRMCFLYTRLREKESEKDVVEFDKDFKLLI